MDETLTVIKLYVATSFMNTVARWGNLHDSPA